MIKFIKELFKSLFTIFIAFIIFTYIFSLKANMSFGNTISYFKAVGVEILGINSSNNTDSEPDNNIIYTSANNNYYYEQLNDIAKIMYSALENNIDNLKKENYTIDFGTTFNELLNTTSGQYKLNKAFQSTLDAFFYDHPELFYLDLTNFSLNTKCLSLASLKTYTVEIIPKENTYLRYGFNSEQDAIAAINQVENIKNSIINNINTQNVYEQIKKVHDTLVETIEYDSTTSQPNTHNIYGALVEKEVVCEGYARAFKYFMDNLNIECILVGGMATNSSGNEEAHMWNYVKLNNEWYGVDVTWDDPIIIGGYSKSNLRHDYFLKGRRSFSVSHVGSGKISDTGMLFNIPTLSDENYKTSSK